MSNTSKVDSSISSPTTIQQSTPLAKFQNIVGSFKLNGGNYLEWSQLVKTCIKGKGKLSHLIGPVMSKDDPRFVVWDEENSQIMSWLWNSMQPEISRTCMFLSTAKEIWESVCHTYFKVRDATQMYELKIRIHNTKQGILFVTEYYNVIRSLWLELDQYQNLRMKCSIDATMHQEFIEQERVYDFLAGKKTSEKDSLWCSYCKKNSHTRETCRKLHGKPLNFFKGSGGKGVNSGYKSQANLAEIGGKQQEESFGQEMELNMEEIDKLKRFNSKLEKPEGYSHFAQIRKVIGHATEEGGLFLLEAESGTTCPTPHTYLSKHHTPTEEQGEPFAEDKEFFPSLPTLPILENSTKTVQIKGSDFSIAVTPENTKKKAPENASNTAPVMPDFSIAVTSGNTQAIALKNASETAPEAVPELPRFESYMQSLEGEDLQVPLKVYSRRKQLAPETPRVPVI
ncbi:hypothetical protein CK203_067093 [Vitis vinifera]|uniref:Retrotransposon Copia-like N-terminal domain-containing protein n=1 Tax=Vitis vinifera TaxID=29760 RepID=A0A438F4Y8_VITVI|nr:hypothetical protein CK203_067093 [Vitis vinifera]